MSNDIFDEPFEGNGTSPSNGTNFTTSNVTIATSVTGSGTHGFSTTQKLNGTFSGRFVTSANTSFLEFADSNTRTTQYWSFYIFPVTNPAANSVIFRAGNAAGSTSATQSFQLVWNTASAGVDPTLKIQNQASTLIGANTGTIPLNQWTRIDITATGGTVSLDVYPGTANKENATGTATGTLNTAGAYKMSGSFTQTNPVRYHALGLTASSTAEFYVDDFRASTTALPGSSSSTSVTPTPAVVAVVTAVGAPTLSTGETPAPAAVAGVASLAAPTVVAGSSATPAPTTVAAVASVGTATPQTASTNVFNEPFTGTNGAALASTNTIFDSFAGTGTAVFDTSVFKSSGSSVHLTTSAAFRYGELTTANVTTRYWSFYVRPHAAPSANTVLFYAGASSATRTFQVVFDTDRTVKIQNSAGTAIGTPTASAMPLDEWSRIDVDCQSGTVTMSLYPGDTLCDQPPGSAAVTNVKSGAAGATAITYRKLGLSGAATNDLWLDEWREDSASIPGPLSFGNTAGPATVPVVASVPAPTVLASASGGALIAVQAWRASGSGTNTFTTFNASFSTVPTSGNLMLCAVECENTVTTPAGWSVASSVVSGAGLYLFFKIAGGSESTLVALTAPVASSFVTGVAEYSGLTGTPLDSAATASTLTSSLTTGSASLTGAADLVVALFGSYGSGPTTMGAPSNGFVEQIDRATSRAAGTNLNMSVGTLTTTVSGTRSSAATAAGVVSGGLGLVAGFQIALNNAAPNPPTIPAPATVPTPGAVGRVGNPAPPTVAVAASVGAAVVAATGFTAVAPPTVAAAVSIDGFTGSTITSRVDPVTVPVVGTIGPPALLGGTPVTNVLPPTVAVVVSVPAPTIPASAAVTALPDTPLFAVTLPAPTIPGSAAATATPDTVQASVALGALAVSGASVSFRTVTVLAVASVPAAFIDITLPVYLFRTPTRQPEGPRYTVDATPVQRGLMRHFHVHSGYPVAVLINGTTITEVQVPTTDQMQAADYVFMGGRDNTVSGPVADLLTDAGYDLQTIG